ncbi:MAG TPA: amidohydrolase [Bacteroidota bacterium]|nr:amidohydrolase [Bacteroidota bacterium]
MNPITKRICSGVIVAACALISFYYVMNSVPGVATLLLINGKIYTVDHDNTIVEAVAIRKNRIVATGRTSELMKSFHADSVIDLGGKTVIPGLIDGHAHMNGLGSLMHSILLFDVPSAEEAVRAVKDRVTQSKKGDWIIGRGWDQNLWSVKQFPTAAMLDAVSPENPVVLIRVDGHAIWVNSEAMRIGNVTRDTKDPPKGKIIRDSKGNPTGIFVEDQARDLIESHVPPLSPAELEENILTAADECLKVGITEVCDMGIDSDLVNAYLHLADEHRLPIRIYASILGPGATWNEWKERSPLIGYGDGMLTIRGLKMYADGALGSRGAALVEAYSDDPGNRGTTTTTEEELNREVRAALEHGYQPMVHAIGDRANSMVLDAYQRILKDLPPGDYRARVEHAQVLLPGDIPRFHELHVLPSMQPVHATSDMYWAEARLGPERIRGAYAWQSILHTGSIVISGSDFPNDAMNPLWGFYAAITRSDRNGYPADGWYRDQCMTRDQALRSYTIWAAYGAFQEKVKGTIEEGKLADLTVLTGDIMEISPSEVLSTDVSMTIVDGKISYVKPTPAAGTK